MTTANLISLPFVTAMKQLAKTSMIWVTEAIVEQEVAGMLAGTILPLELEANLTWSPRQYKTMHNSNTIPQG